MELNNYNFNRHPKNLSDQQISGHQDFDALLTQFEDQKVADRPRPLRLLYLVGGLAAAALVGFLFYQTVSTNFNSAADVYFAEQAYVNPPIPGLAADFEQQLVSSEGGTFEYNGSKIVFPAAAFVDQNGQPVSGDVNVRYREFHDFVDFFLSGIPMEYDSAGTYYQLESAGMLEIFAEKNGERLNVAPGKSIDVELVSDIAIPASYQGSIPRFNVYKLDKQERNWKYTGRDQIEIIETVVPEKSETEKALEEEQQQELAKIEQRYQTELATIERTIPKPSAPVKPKRHVPDAYSFELNFEADDITTSRTNDQLLNEAIADELAARKQLEEWRQKYANMMWQVVEDANFDQEAAANTNWEDMKIQQLNKRDYELTLIAPNRQMTLTVNPVLTGADYEDALQNFNKDFAEHQKELVNREAQLQDQKDALQQRIADARAIAEQKYEEKIATYRSKGRNHMATNEMIRHKIINRFQATSFGIWNCDRPLPPFIAKVKGEFIDDRQNAYSRNTAFLVDKSRNTVCRFYTGEKSEIAFNKNSDNLLWLVTPENKIAVFRPEEFKRINKDKDEYTFVMNVIDKKIEKEEDVRQILQF